MRKAESPFGKSARYRGRFSAAVHTALVALLLLSPSVKADPPVKPTDQPSGTNLDTITVNAKRERAILEHRVDNFVYGITVTPFEDSIARWQAATPICPLVAGLSQDDGEYMLTRLSQIATTAGASLAPEKCKPNFFVVITSVPAQLIAAWSKRNNLFGDANRTKLRRFMTSSNPVRVWYNVQLQCGDDGSLASGGGGLAGAYNAAINGIPICMFTASDPGAGHLLYGTVRNISSVIMVIDAGLAKGTSFGQLSAYVAMNGLAEIRTNARVGDAPSILQLFNDPASAPPLGLSPWDAAFLKAIYHTEQTDKTQLLAVKDSVVHDLAP
jgi:hypothetical protein